MTNNIYKQKNLFGRLIQVDLFGEIESDKEIIVEEKIKIHEETKFDLFNRQTYINIKG